ncbi:hypothetical protein, partial [Prevotella denticola]|uniref:hypothetical protein n=1 Tax=Prevotella denticola TaxID=28129 RepID=UPI0028EE243A
MVNPTNTNGVKQILLHHISLLDKGEARAICHLHPSAIRLRTDLSENTGSLLTIIPALPSAQEADDLYSSFAISSSRFLICEGFF